MKRALSFPAVRFTELLTVCVISLVLSGCTSTTVEIYYRPADARVDKAFIKQGVDFSVYTKLLPDPMEIWYDERERAPETEDLKRIRAYFREAFLSAVGDAYELVTEPGSDVLRVRASLIDLKVNPGSPESVPQRSRLRSVVSSGKLTLVMELMDSRSNEVLAAAADREKSKLSVASPDASKWEEVEAAAKRWAGLFRDWLDKNLKPRD